MNNMDFFEKINCGALICKNDKYSTIIKANKWFYTMIGYTEDEMKAIHKNRFSELVVDDLTEILKKVKEAINTKNQLDYEFRIKTKNNQILYIHDIATYDKEHDIFNVVIMDISYRENNLLKIYNTLEKDIVSNLLNRSALERQIKKRISRKIDYSQAMLIIDLDNFKSINDSMGHQKGDEVISYIGIKLRSIFNNNEIIGRLGGDEFVVYLENIQKKELEILLKKVIKELEFNVEKIKIGCSIGVAYDEYSLHNFQGLYKIADFALYLIKNDQKGRYLIRSS